MRLRKWYVVGRSEQTGIHFSWADRYILKSVAETDANFLTRRVSGATYEVYRWDNVPAEVAHLIK